MINDLDVTDVAILRILQKDALLTNKEIATQLNKSITTIHERIKRLTELEFISRTVAILNRKKIDKRILVFSHILLNDHAYVTLEAFEREVIKFPEVMECFHMTGAFDFLLRICTDSIDEYHDFYRYQLASLPNITTVQSYFVLYEAKSDTAYPL